MVYGVWFGVYGAWCMVYGLGFMVYGVWCMVWGLWCMVHGLRVMVQRLGRGSDAALNTPPQILRSNPRRTPDFSEVSRVDRWGGASHTRGTTSPPENLSTQQRVYGLWFMVLRFMVYGAWFVVYGLRFMVYGLGRGSGTTLDATQIL
jgi:hypothetical protein